MAESKEVPAFLVFDSDSGKQAAQVCDNLSHRWRYSLHRQINSNNMFSPMRTMNQESEVENHYEVDQESRAGCDVNNSV